MYLNRHKTHYNIIPNNVCLFLISQVVAQDVDGANNKPRKGIGYTLYQRGGIGSCSSFIPRSGHDAEEMQNFVDGLNFKYVHRT